MNATPAMNSSSPGGSGSLNATPGVSSQAAYFESRADAPQARRALSAQQFYALACNPQRSVVVQACAGAGKTWILVSRILRALLEGVQPEQILAITFTRKAAAEMRLRLAQWLAEFGQASSAHVREQALIERGLSRADAVAVAPALAALQEQMLAAERPVQILTFHAWFEQLVAHAPMQITQRLGLPASHSLLQDSQAAIPSLLLRFQARVARTPQLHQRYREVVARQGRHTVKQWLQAVVNNAVDWHSADAAGVLGKSLAPCGQIWPACKGFEQPLWQVMTSGFAAQAQAAASALLGHKNKLAKAAGTKLLQAMQEPGPQLRWAQLMKALFTEDGPRASLGDDAATWALIDTLELIGQQQQHHEAWLDQEAMVPLGRALLQEWQALKLERRWVDMPDLERAAQHMLADEQAASWIAQSLDRQVRSLLIDEFQDTNPVQWQALSAWLGAYAGAGGGASGQKPPAVFIVGDPKQAIYAFRGSDAAIFKQAQQLVVQGLEGQLLECDHTRRCSPAVVQAVNAVFSGVAEQGLWEHFQPHSTQSQAQGLVQALSPIAWPVGKLRRGNKEPVAKALALEVSHADLPKAAVQATQATPADEPPLWRPSLSQAREEDEEHMATQEARQVAAWVREHLMAGVAPGQVMVLARQRSSLSRVADELAGIGIAYAVAQKLDLAACAETQDLVALLDVLSSPAHDLSLAQALKSPLFGASDEDLIELAKRVGVFKRRGEQRGEPKGEQKGEKTGEKTAEKTGEPGDEAMPESGSVRGSWWQALCAAQSAGTPSDEPWALPPSLARARKLLLHWASLAQELSTHDLLDRIFHEGQVLQRYAAVVPAPGREQALQALDALLWASLRHEGGAMPNVYRFVRDVRAGRVQAQAALPPDAVQLLTIHGAKGLEAQAVIVADCHVRKAGKQDPELLSHWPAHSAAPVALAFVRSPKTVPAALSALADFKRLQAEHEELNALYVAMTRAEQWLALSGRCPEPAKAHEGKPGFPVLTNPASRQTWWARLALALQLPLETMGERAGTSLASDEPAHSALHRPLASQPAQVWVLPTWIGAAESALGDEARSSTSLALKPLAPPLPPQSLASRIGQAWHKALEWASAKPGLLPRHQWQHLAHAAARQFQVPTAEWPALEAAMQAVLTSDVCASFFDSRRLVWAGNEVAVPWQGQALRLDRLVALKEPKAPNERVWWVLDYKLDSKPERNPELRHQLHRYQQAVRALQPSEEVKAAFITGQGRLIECTASPF